MRLKSIWISNYKNLQNFSLSFDGESFLDIFVGKNGTGKSNFFEALVEVFHFVFSSVKRRSQIGFSFDLVYEITGQEVRIHYENGQMVVNGRQRATIGSVPVPDNLIIYYSGHSDTIDKTVRAYAKSYARRNKKWTGDEARKFISIGSEYKEMLLSILLMQSDDCAARQYVCTKLGIDATSETATLTLTPPRFRHQTVEVGDTQSFLWGSQGISLAFVERLLNCVRGGFSRDSIFNPEQNLYSIPINRDLFAKEFENTTASDLFRSLDNLKTLGMFKSLSIPIGLDNGQPILVKDFSDGQFQSIYIFAISELFKDRNCVTLLDEPDSFLHPEWQFEFLKQVVDIAGTEAAQTNHVLLSSHSASTITKSEKPEIQIFEIGENGVGVTSKPKASVVETLSAGLITLSETEASLGIYETVENTTGAILFTEGPSDKRILDEAIRKLYPDERPGIDIVPTFGRAFLRTLFASGELSNRYGDRKMFALFDFDEAYADWYRLTADSIVQDDPHRCTAKKLAHTSHYAMLLPVPEHDALKRLALDGDGNPIGTERACLSIEHLFCDADNLGDHFSSSDIVGRGPVIKFRGSKTTFASETVPQFPPEKFEIFRHIFNVVTAEIAAPA
ncbi:ATP-dependent nuclease [Thalassococcus lentus]|uniref:AAA family ATPase n=1 Tax=Thalassococcus lentus TaxID=1210524 RepID=A0ABT4XTY3_9RHOB|nr:AAA family ATPase [Thalassococcus lentus]MDA7425429.1 AAA family ATPase [Thalassococcus lentus]